MQINDTGLEADELSEIEAIEDRQRYEACWAESLPKAVRAVAEKFPIGSRWGGSFDTQGSVFTVEGYRTMHDGEVKVWIRKEGWSAGIRIDVDPRMLGEIKPKPVDYFPGEEPSK